ncbi:MAG TPA: antitoxin [Candidatus Polarisedimenticolia bacterium]
MSKRLQVLLDNAEYREVRSLVRAERLTVAEWVRQALQIALQRNSTGDSDRKLAAIRTAAAHEFPSGDMTQILAEIERGYLDADGR